MTDEQARELGRWALAAGYRFAPGALTLDGIRIIDVIPANRAFGIDARIVAVSGEDILDDYEPGRMMAVPDFRDPATLGTLVAQVRERWNMPSMYASDWTDECAHEPDPENRDRWCVQKGVNRGRDVSGGDTEAEAWVAALEARPLAPAGEDE